MSKIYVAGHTGMVGSALLRKLKGNLVYRTHKELDLMSQKDTREFFKQEKPDFVFLCAAKVGGIYANMTYPADFIYQNLMIQTNIIHAAYENGVKKLLFLGSSCMYPQKCPQPMKEEDLLCGRLEPTNDAYILAKLAGLKMCQAYNKQYGCNFISIIPPNLYGPGDNYNLENSHVISALIHKFHKAKVNDLPYVDCWGDGSARREFMYIDDLIDIILFVMGNHNCSESLNVGVGEDISILSLANLIKKIIGYSGEIRWDVTAPEGVKQKLLETSKLKELGYSGKFINLEEGIKLAYNDYLERKIG